MRRELRFEPGYDYRSEDADKPANAQRGAHGLNIRFLVHGASGTVQFLLYTGWLPSWVHVGVTLTTVKHEASRVDDLYPMAADFGHHWDTPTYSDAEPMMPCEFRPTNQCYYDGSSLRAERLLGVLLTQGHEAVWTALESEYAALVNDMETREATTDGH